MPDKSSTAFWEKWALFMATSSFKHLQMLLWVKIYSYATIYPFLNSRLKCHHTVFFLFQKTKPGTHHLTGIIITPLCNFCPNKIIKISSKRN